MYIYVYIEWEALDRNWNVLFLGNVYECVCVCVENWLRLKLGKVFNFLMPKILGNFAKCHFNINDHS